MPSQNNLNSNEEITFSPDRTIRLRPGANHSIYLEMKRCNLCGNAFKPVTKFDRFCGACKTTSEVYRFSEWLESA